ncbi:hypothetical protein [Lactococcus petauri]|uniref:hypothetical protein n=1 Tax=Lactococcus petauri TaxID=1940789 RepID=UPI001F576DE8|nr:hypothetical protein [Lactococcus petauri]
MNEKEIDKKIAELKQKKKALQERKFTQLGKAIAKEFKLKSDEDFATFVKKIKVEIESARLKNTEPKKTAVNPEVYRSNIEQWTGENNN